VSARVGLGGDQLGNQPFAERSSIPTGLNVGLMAGGDALATRARENFLIHSAAAVVSRS
jgi:hypothetical protein